MLRNSSRLLRISSRPFQYLHSLGNNKRFASTDPTEAPLQQVWTTYVSPRKIYSMEKKRLKNTQPTKEELAKKAKEQIERKEVLQTNINSVDPENKNVFVVVHIKGHQHKIHIGETVTVQRMEADLGSEIYLHKVLMAANTDVSFIGTPILDSSIVTVKAVVTEHLQTAKAIVYKYKKKKRQSKKNHHRSLLTTLKITDIVLNPQDVHVKSCV